MANPTYRYCMDDACRALWDDRDPERCPACDKMGSRDSVAAALCTFCDVSWHPGVTFDCWMCGRRGIHSPMIRSWESAKDSAPVISSELFPAYVPVG